MSPGGTFVRVNVPFGLTGAVMSEPTTVTVMPGPVRDAKLPALELSADSAAPVIDPSIVARLPVVGVLGEPDNSVGADGDDEPHAPVPSAIATSDTKTIRFL